MFIGSPRVVLYGVAFPRLSGKPVVLATYILDDRSPFTSELPDVLDTTNAVFFSADDLPNGSHTLTVEVDAGPSYPYVVDYLEYQSFVADSAVSSPSSAASSPPATPSSTISTILPSSTQSSTVAPSGTGAPSAGSSEHEIGPIVGGAIGGSALLCIMVVAVVWYLLRRRAEESTRKSSIFSGQLFRCPILRSLSALLTSSTFSRFYGPASLILPSSPCPNGCSGPIPSLQNRESIVRKQASYRDDGAVRIRCEVLLPSFLDNYLPGQREAADNPAGAARNDRFDLVPWRSLYPFFSSCLRAHWQPSSI